MSLEAIDIARKRIQKSGRSKNGCAGCKLSKVKCDEVKPRCGRCVKREDECTYSTATRTLIAVAVSKQTKPTPVKSKGNFSAKHIDSLIKNKLEAHKFKVSDFFSSLVVDK